MNRAPAGVGRQNLSRASPMLDGEEVASRDALAGSIRAKSPLNELL
jgi:hypothetical protein